MATSEACGDRIAPREVTVRPVRDAHERRRWDALTSEFHYLPFNGLFGQSLRHVAVRGETWVALVGWTAGAFKVGVRDAWIGWSRERQFRRLKLIANNSRFVILGGKGATRNLASRVLGLSLRRLSRDMRAAHGFPVLLAETFVDPSRFAGTCYRASNWRMLGRTRGTARARPLRSAANRESNPIPTPGCALARRFELGDAHRPCVVRRRFRPAALLRRGAGGGDGVGLPARFDALERHAQAYRHRVGEEPVQPSGLLHLAVRVGGRPSFQGNQHFEREVSRAAQPDLLVELGRRALVGTLLDHRLSVVPRRTPCRAVPAACRPAWWLRR